MEEIAKQNEAIQTSMTKMMDLFQTLRQDVDNLKTTQSVANKSSQGLEETTVERH